MAKPLTKAQDLKENLYIAEAMLREEMRKADPVLVAKQKEMLLAGIAEMQAKINALDAGILAGAQRIVEAQKHVALRKQLLLEHLGKDSIARLQVLVEAQLRAAMGLKKPK